MKHSFSISIRAIGFLCILFPTVAQAQQGQRFSCSECHSKLGASYAEIVEQWKGSVHARSGVYCSGCHGGDPTVMDMNAMSPAKGFKGAPKAEETPQFCGKCHPGVEEDYLASLHGRALGKGGPQCVTCHGSHGIKLASLDLINEKDCTRCHSFERAATIREALAGTDKRISDLNQQLQKLHRVGIDVQDQNHELFDTRNRFHRLFHSVEVQEVRDHTAEIQSRLNEINKRVESIEDTLARRKQAGAIVVILLLIMAALFFYVRHTYKWGEHHRSG